MNNSSLNLSAANSLNLESILMENLNKTSISLNGLPAPHGAAHTLSDDQQIIQLQGNDNSNTYQINGKDVEILPSKNSLQSRNASNKIKVSKIVNYEWDQWFNNGQLISVHKSGTFFAYSIQANSTGKVRVFHKKLSEKILLKSFTGRVVDLSFAHYDLEVLLGCLDETGCLQVFKIYLENNHKIQFV
jgi:hypothetical protein